MQFSSPQGTVYPLSLMQTFRWKLIITSSYLTDNTNHTDLVEFRLSELMPYKNEHAQLEKESLTVSCLLLTKEWDVGGRGMVGFFVYCCFVGVFLTAIKT